MTNDHTNSHLSTETLQAFLEGELSRRETSAAEDAPRRVRSLLGRAGRVACALRGPRRPLVAPSARGLPRSRDGPGGRSRSRPLSEPGSGTGSGNSLTGCVTSLPTSCRTSSRGRSPRADAERIEASSVRLRGRVRTRLTPGSRVMRRARSSSPPSRRATGSPSGSIADDPSLRRLRPWSPDCADAPHETSPVAHAGARADRTAAGPRRRSPARDGRWRGSNRTSPTAWSAPTS